MIVKDDTLHLPRLLCLHGGGTNARIFQAQCRVLERALKPFFRLCYAEAPYPSFPGPDVTSVYADMGPFKAWIRQDGSTGDSSDEAVETAILEAVEADNSLGASCPFIGLLGFSQGARLSGSMLYARQLLNNSASFLGCRLPDFKFAILLAGRGPLISLFRDNSSQDVRSVWANNSPVTSTQDAERIVLPTLHVHGLQDPNLDLHRNFMVDACDQSSVKVIQWDGAHRVPIKTKDVASLVEGILSVAHHACSGEGKTSMFDSGTINAVKSLRN